MNNENITVTFHDEYIKQQDRWEKIYDALQDEMWIKSKRIKYLPMPSGMLEIKDPKIQTLAYNAYVQKAIYYRYVSHYVQRTKSLLTKKQIDVNVPEKMESIIQSAGEDNDSLQTIINRVFDAQLTYSRYGLLVDIPKTAEGMNVIPHILEYAYDKIINWATAEVNGKKQTVAIILDESYHEREEGLKSELIEEYRICALANYETANPIYYTYKATDEEVKTFMLNQEPPENAKFPNIKGKTLNYIPFQICNALSLEWETEIPLLISVADMALAIYRGEADYRQALFMQGQATPYAIGVDTDTDTLAFGATSLVKITNPDGKVGFIEVGGSGLNAMKDGLEGLHTQQEKLGLSLANAGANQSGEALSVRLGLQTASLTGVSNVNKKCMKNILGYCADWMGLEKEDIALTYPTDFISSQKSIDELLKLAELVNKGQYAREDYYNWLFKNEYTTIPTYEEWAETITEDNPFGVDEETQRIIDEANANLNQDEDNEEEN